MSQATTSKMPLAGPATQTELSTIENGILDALYSCHSGTSRPSYAISDTVWLDTTGITVDGVTGIHVLNIYDGADDIPLIYVDPTNNRMWSNESAPEITIVSAATTDVLGAKSPRLLITESNGPISSLGTAPNRMVWTRLEMDNVFTHSATLQCPGGVDFAGKAGMRLLWASDSDGVPSLYGGMNEDGSPLVANNPIILPVGAAPSTPGTGKLAVYAKTGGVLAVKDDAGTETELGAGAVVLVDEQIVSSAQATVDFDLPEGYRFFLLEIESALPATDATIPILRFSQAGTFLSGASDYLWGLRSIQSSSPVDDGSSSGDSKIQLTSDSAGAGVPSAGPGFSATIDLRSIGGSPNVDFRGSYVASGGGYGAPHGGGVLKANTSAIDGVRFQFLSGNVAGGKYRLIGFR